MSESLSDTIAREVAQMWEKMASVPPTVASRICEMYVSYLLDRESAFQNHMQSPSRREQE